MVAKIAMIILVLIAAAWVCQIDPCGWNVCETTIEQHMTKVAEESK